MAFDFGGLMPPRPANEPPVALMAEAVPAGIDLGEALAVLAVVRQRANGKTTGASYKGVLDKGRAGARLEVVRIARIDDELDVDQLARDFRVAVTSGDELRRPAGRHSVFVAASGPRALPDGGRAQWSRAFRAVKAAIDWAASEAEARQGQTGIVLVGKFLRETREPAGYEPFVQLELAGLVQLDAHVLERPAARALVAAAPDTAAAVTRTRTRRANGPREEA